MPSKEEKKVASKPVLLFDELDEEKAIAEITELPVEVKEDAQNLLKETSPITIQPKETKTLKLVVDTAIAATKNPKSSGGFLGGLIAGKDQDYDGTISLITPGGTTQLAFRMFKKKK